MRGTTTIFVGILVLVLGLAGLGLALAQMMTHADPNGALISVGGLGVFVVVSLFLAVMAHYS
jgi:hypothetical protein